MQASQFKTITRQWAALVHMGKLLHFSAGQVLFYEDHNPYGVHVLHSGKVHFTKDQSPCEPEASWMSDEGEVFGLDHVLEGTPYSYTCIADTDCQVTIISKSNITEQAASSASS